MATPWIGGVSSGIASYLGIHVAPVRIAFAALSSVGIGVIIYLLFWLFMPTDAEARVISQATLRDPLRQVGPNRDNQVVVGRLLVVGAAFIAVGMALWFVPLIGSRAWEAVAALALVVAGVGLVWMQSSRFASGFKWSVIGVMILGFALITVGITLFLDYRHLLPVVQETLVVTVVIVTVVGVSLVPLGMRLFRDLTTSRENEARETERAEIAAHLHDSVLQTLTLIRGAADDPSRVRSLALTQEGELRSWLYTGSLEPGESVAQSLRDQAAGIESNYGTLIEVVTVGDTVPGPAELAAVAAAAEAITNAVRHGAPPITVFQEVKPDAIEISVKDSGEGFDPDEIPDDRHGFRHSIKGRVARVGGVVTVRSVQATQSAAVDDELSRSGTEIRIRIPRNGKS